jgi:hypothetical protein
MQSSATTGKSTKCVATCSLGCAIWTGWSAAQITCGGSLLGRWCGNGGAHPGPRLHRGLCRTIRARAGLLTLHVLHDEHPVRGSAPDRGCPSKRVRPTSRFSGIQAQRHYPLGHDSHDLRAARFLSAEMRSPIMVHPSADPRRPRRVTMNRTCQGTTVEVQIHISPSRTMFGLEQRERDITLSDQPVRFGPRTPQWRHANSVVPPCHLDMLPSATT